MDFKDLLKLARRRWKTIVAFFVIAMVAGAVVSLSTTPTYQSKARIFISTNVSNSAAAFYGSAFSSQQVQSYADLATSETVMRRVIDKLRLNLTPRELAGKIETSVPANTVIIEVKATDTDPRTAQELAQADAQALTTYLDEIQAPNGKGKSPVKATVTDQAQFNGDPVSPRTGLNLAVAAIVGLLVGCAVAVARDLLDTTVKSPEDIEAVTPAPVMTHIGFDPDVPKSPLLTDVKSHTPRAEAFRLLRTNLQFLDLDAEPKSFVVTSAVPEEGKTSTSTNLAIALAQAGKRVLLVDGDLRRPRVAPMLGLESAVGLTTVLVGRSTLEESVQRHAESGVHLLASGPIPPNPTEILQSRATRDLLKTLRDQYDVVVIDAPPLLPVADAAIMATGADGAIMVLRHGRTTREQLRHGVNRIEQVGARLFGVVVNMTPRRGGNNYYGYGYGYGYGYTESSR